MRPMTQSSLNGSLYDHQLCSISYCCCCCCCCTQTTTTATTTTASFYSSSYCDSDDPLRQNPASACSLCDDRIPHHQPPEEETSWPTKQAKRRMHAIHELLQTERDYVNDLARLVEVYFDTLCRQHWITQEHKTIITRNAAEILTFHRDFFTVMNSTNHDDDDGQHIAQTFLDMGEDFKLYTAYCENHEEACLLCEEYRDRPEWTDFIKECASVAAPENMSFSSSILSGPLLDPMSQLTSRKRLKFEDYMIKPVQRICRYQLLIREIIQHTVPGGPGFDELNQAMGFMQRIVTDIDERKKSRNIQQCTDRFVQRIDVSGDWRISKQHIERLGNVLIAGSIEVTYTALGQSVSKPRYLGCFVFTSYLILVRPKKATSYEPKHWFPLRFAELEDLSDIEGQREHAFVVRCKKHTFAFSSTSSQEKQLWMKFIQEAITTSKAADNKKETDDLLIVPSLSGIACSNSSIPKLVQEQDQNVRLSRSFTSILDMKLPSSPVALKRSVSTTLQLRESRRNSSSSNGGIGESTSIVDLKKRHSVDYPASPRRKEALIKSRNNSESYISSRKARPNSMDILSSSPSMLKKLKSSHQNALRIAVDHKLRDVCTQDYLSARMWYVRNDGIDMKKRRSMPSFMRSSTSTFSIITPNRRTSDATKLTPTHPPPDFEVQSTVSSASTTDSNTRGTASRTTHNTNHFHQLHRHNNHNNAYSGTSAGHGCALATVSGSVFSGSFSTYSVNNAANTSQHSEASKKNALVDRMLHKLTKRFSRRQSFLDHRRRPTHLHSEDGFPSDTYSYHVASEADHTLYERGNRRSTLFRWAKSDSGKPDYRDHPNMSGSSRDGGSRSTEQPSIAFAYASTPSAHARSRWHRRVKETS
ncbi:hypothetical protein BX666DRAFT_1969918 [Dichotomocladium elegans]|nr:hypothetical protein BX666DRAFT_1969918 [Dichotomocladium elegans]